MKKLIIFFVLLTISAGAFAFYAAPKPYTTRTGHIWFQSKAPLENIEAHNYQVSSALNTTSGEMAFSVLIKAFEFEKALMQEHFNENYMESAKFPTATFKGKITDISKVNFSKKGTYSATVEGMLTIHGIAQTVKHNGTITVADDAVLVKAVFHVKPKDYNIEIPRLVKDKIAEAIDVNVDMKYQRQ